MTGVSVRAQYWWHTRSQMPWTGWTTHYTWKFVSKTIWTKGCTTWFTPFSSATKTNEEVLEVYARWMCKVFFFLYFVSFLFLLCFLFAFQLIFLLLFLFISYFYYFFISFSCGWCFKCEGQIQKDGEMSRVMVHDVKLPKISKICVKYICITK